MSQENHTAPGQLELVRVLLNTWRLPNRTRVPEDHFDAFAAEQGLTNRDEAARLKRLRDDVRSIVEGKAGADLLNVWLHEVPLRIAVEATGAGAAIRYQHEAGIAGKVLTAILKTIEAGQWARLKACPDCRLVFFDHTRNGSKRWCGMYAGGPQGRACGTIAKVRRHRARQKGDRG